MQKIIIIGANEPISFLILKAKEMGFETHVFSWPNDTYGKSLADYFYPISIDEKEKILEVSKNINAKGVVSITSDFAVETVNYVSSNLNLVGNSIISTSFTRDKFQMRNRFTKFGLITPRFKLIELNNLDNLSEFFFPGILKPLDKWGSTDVKYINNKRDLKRHLENYKSFYKKMLFEDFVVGHEFSAECISFKGKHSIIAITKKFTSGAPNFVEKGHLILSEPFEGANIHQKDLIKEVIFKGLDALEINYGLSHSEFIMTKYNQIILIEIGARMGGDYIGTDLVKLATGYDYIKSAIDISIGEKPEEKNNYIDTNPSIVYFFFTILDRNKIYNLKESHMINVVRENIFFEPIKNIESSKERFGYVIFTVTKSANLDFILDYLFGVKK